MYFTYGGLFVQKNIRKQLIIISMLSLILVMAAFLSAFGSSVSNATGQVKGKSVVLRKTASTSAKSVKKLKDNTKLTIKKIVFTSKSSIAAKNKWYYVTVDSKKGYIRSDYVDTLKYTKTGAKTIDDLNYRKGAGTKMAQVGTYKKGKSIDIVLMAAAKTDKDTWYQVENGSKYYYVNGDYVKFQEEGAASSTAITPVVEEPVNNGEPVFTKSDITYPTSMEVGASFNLTGKVTCDKKISKVKFGITDEDGDWSQVCNLNVNSKTFNVSKVDNDVHFGRIIPGKYKYIGQFYVEGKWYKSVIKHSFTVAAIKTDLTDKIVKQRIQEMRDALEGKYFTTNGKACRDNDAEPCNVCKVITQNKTVKNFIKTNKGEGTVNTALFPYHYSPTEGRMNLGWSCCGFAGFAGWYVGADDVNSNVDYAIVKNACNFDKNTFKKYARVGDIVRTRTHSFMVISVKDDGCEVIDSNWGCTCICSVHTINWELFKNTYDIVTISRATNRK